MLEDLFKVLEHLRLTATPLVPPFSISYKCVSYPSCFLASYIFHFPESLSCSFPSSSHAYCPLPPAMPCSRNIPLAVLLSCVLFSPLCYALVSLHNLARETQ